VNLFVQQQNGRDVGGCHGVYLVEILLCQDGDVGLGLEPAEERTDDGSPSEDVVRRYADRRDVVGDAEHDRLPPTLDKSGNQEEQ
jgi:hypothetical protein